MKSAAGLWIDHSKAVIVIVSAEGEKTKQMESGMEKHVRFSGGSRSEQGGGNPSCYLVPVRQRESSKSASRIKAWVDASSVSKQLTR
jgi:hypothetical protein